MSTSRISSREAALAARFIKPSSHAYYVNSKFQQETTGDSTVDEDELIDFISYKDVGAVLEFFIKHPNYGAILERSSKCRMDVLYPAIQNNQPHILDHILLRNKFNIGSSLFEAVRAGSKECVEIILQYIGDGDEGGPEMITEGSFLSPLMLAIHMEHHDIIEFFINKKYRIRLDHKNDPYRTDVLSSLSRIHSYRALASPLYIAYSYLNSEDPHPMFQIFKLNDVLITQGAIDFEFKNDYQDLSKELEKFAVDLLEQCHGLDEIKFLTDVNDELQAEKEKDKIYKYIEVRSDKTKELTAIDLAIRSGNVEFVAHPYSQLLLNKVLYMQTIYKIFESEPPWRKRSVPSTMGYFLRHTLMLPFLTLMFLFCPDICEGLKSPVVKFLSHTGSFCIFVALLMLASFQDKFSDNIARPTVLDWLILVWVCGLVVQEAKEFYHQGFHRYVHQWWNIISFVMLLLFVLSYVLHITAYGISYGQFGILDSLSKSFTPSAWYQMMLVSNGMFTVAMVLSFVHLSSAFQVSDVFGPMQLSLYMILLDVFKFLIFFFTLFMAFGFGLRRLYSHYISTQKFLHRGIMSGHKNSTQLPETEHAFSDVLTSLHSLFWSVFGMTDLSSFATKGDDYKITKMTGELLFGLFQILIVIIAVNMLIAMMSRSYQNIADNADSQWKMSRTQMWMNWVDEGNVIPPPFNIFPNICKVCKVILEWMKKKCLCCTFNIFPNICKVCYKVILDWMKKKCLCCTGEDQSPKDMYRLGSMNEQQDNNDQTAAMIDDPRHTIRQLIKQYLLKRKNNQSIN